MKRAPVTLDGGELVRLEARGLTRRQLAAKFRCGKSTIDRAIARQRGRGATKEATMPARRTDDATTIARVLELHQNGGSAREIADLVGRSPPTVVRWLRERALEPNGGHGSRMKRKPKPKLDQGAEAAALVASKVEAELESGRLSGIEVVRRRLAAVRGVLDGAEARLEGGEFGAPLYARLVGLERELAAQVDALTPTEGAADPNREEETVRAAEEFTAKIEKLVARAEESCRCLSCGANPFKPPPPRTVHR